MKIILNDPPYGDPLQANIFKEISSLDLTECKLAFNSRLVENNRHPNSGFKKSIDQEMILLKERIKFLRNSNK